jgi:hypothetical protein
MRNLSTVWAIGLALALGACQKPQVQSVVPIPSPPPHDPALQAALDELTRIQSYTQTGVTYAQYSDRLLTAKGNIDVDLQRTNDEPANAQIQRAISYYITALDDWKRKIDNDTTYVEDFTQEDWSRGGSAITLAAKYAFSDSNTRREIEEQEAREEKELLKAEEEAAQAVKAEQQREELARQEAQKEARLEQEQQEKEAAERERVRRFAPAGTVYSTMLISVTDSSGVASIPPGAELRVTNKNADGTLRIQYGDLSANVQSSQVTNDRDLAAAVRANDLDKQAAIRQWQAQQAEAAAQMEADKEANSYHPQNTPPPQDTYVSPLDQGPHP